MKIFRFLPIAFAIVLGLSSCGDENSAIGSSIVDTNIEIVVDSSFQELITVESVPNDSVVGRTITQLIGRISIPVLVGVVLTYQVVGTLGEWMYIGNFYNAIQDFRIGIPGMCLQVFGGYLFIRYLIRK